MDEVGNETELVTVSQHNCQICQTVAGELQTKLSQIKRRKQVLNETLITEMKSLCDMATTFARLYSQLASATPKPAELKSLMTEAFDTYALKAEWLPT